MCRKSRRASSSRPCPVAADVTTTATAPVSRVAPLRGGPLRLLRGDQVGLRQAEDPRQLRESVPVSLQLGLDGRVVGSRVGAVQRRDVEDVDQQAGALHVGEELVPEPGALARALDQARDVGHDELAIGRLERAEHRLERGERVVRDLRMSAREPRQERGLPGVRQPDEARVRQQLQPELEPALLAGEPALGEPRRLPGGVGEALVAPPARAAARHDGALSGRGQVEPQLAVDLLHHGAGRHRDLERRRTRAVPLAALAVASARRLEVRAPPEGLEVAQRRIADEHDRRPVSPVAAVRPALRDVRLAAERDRPAAAGAALDEDLRAICEHGPTPADEAGFEAARRAPPTRRCGRAAPVTCARAAAGTGRRGSTTRGRS